MQADGNTHSTRAGCLERSGLGTACFLSQGLGSALCSWMVTWFRQWNSPREAQILKTLIVFCAYLGDALIIFSSSAT